MQRVLRSLSNLPIERKLLLTSVFPMLAVMALSLVTYQSVQTFSEDEEQLNNIYLTQRKAAEYMQLALDLQVGFRGYVLTQQERFLDPFRQAEIHVLLVGDSLAMMVPSDDPKDLRIGPACGASGYVVKPDTLEELATVLADLACNGLGRNGNITSTAQDAGDR
ncbi:MAG: CHASE3 domain-containing protein [Nitrospiraceae bacterium]